MFIKPMNVIESIGQFESVNRKESRSENVFKDIFQKALDNVIDTEKEVYL